jgi:translation initiation factor IF-2
MSEEKMMRLGQVSRKLNVGKDTIISYLANKGFEIESSPNAKITSEQYKLLAKEFAASLLEKEEAENLTIGHKQENVVIEKIEERSKHSDEDDEILIKNLRIGDEADEETRPAETTESTDSKEPSIDEEKSIEETPGPIEEKTEETTKSEKPKLQGIKVLGKIDLEDKPKKAETKSSEEVEKEAVEAPEAEPEVLEEKEEKVEAPESESSESIPEVAPEVDESKDDEGEEEEKTKGVIEAKADKLKGLKVVGKIDLPKVPVKKDKPVASSDESVERKKKKRPRKRIESSPPRTTAQSGQRPQRGRRKDKVEKEELSDKEIQEKIKATLAKLSTGTKKSTGAKYRREKRATQAEAREEALIKEQEDSKVLQVTEFISANDLASLMEANVNDVISTCLGMGMFVSINQRLDAESITLIADEFGYNVEFISSKEEEDVVEKVDTEEQLKDRAPIVTIMGHVDHGKTSLLDYIRKTEVTATEAGGITQHIGAYDVTTKGGNKIAFLDTPGHEAFTAMRARGASVTDVVIVVVAADDHVMPQTKEAINHAQVAGVPIVIAINKMDRPNANPEKIKEELANINILVEDWGGKYQSQEISAKSGDGVEELLEKVLLESELLELKANPDKGAVGATIEASLDKGRGFVATLLVQAGTMRVGDILLAGSHFGRVKAMFDHTGKKVKEAGPATPVLVLGLNGAPQAGEKFNVMESEREAREIANRREQIQREQNIRTKKHITLDEIGRRLAIGSFKELNVIVKGDVDGSIEALSDSLLKLSTDEIQVNIIHKAVGQISESDVLLASASDGIIIGFQVRPSTGARKLAEQEEIEIRLYSIIYDAINEVKDAMEGMLAPEVEEVIVGNAEVRDVFKISRIGTVAGCMVTDGIIKRNNEVRLIRDGIVVYTGKIAQLRRFKDDVTEVKTNYECGISIENFNDIKMGDVIEGFEQQEFKRKL